MHLKIKDDKQEIIYPMDYCYKMDHRNRGLCLIFNHERFSTLSPRRGTRFDRNRLRDTFKSLQFKVKIFDNRGKEEIMCILEKGNFLTFKLTKTSLSHRILIVIFLFFSCKKKPFTLRLFGNYNFITW